MVDISIGLKIPSDKIETAKTGWFKIYPNSELDGEGNPKYTEIQWFNEKLRRLVIRDVRRGLQMIANEEVSVEDDDSLVVSD